MRPLHAVHSNLVSAAVSAIQEYSRCKPETFPNFGLIPENHVQRRSAGLFGWRRSASRTCLQANSLLSGNLTGNFAILGLQDQISEQQTDALQRIFVKFPTQINRENIPRNREISYGNREF